MKDRRSVDDLSVEELQRVLAEKKSAARDARLAKYRHTGRALPAVPIGAAPEASDIEAPRPRARRSLLRRFFDFFLLLVEVGAVVGLIYLFYNGYNTWRALNQEVKAIVAESVPTLTPTPLVSIVVLPSGHTPPDQSGYSQPNDAEIPANLRPLVQSLPPPVIPTQGPTQARRLIIPAIDVDRLIGQGDDWEQLRKGVVGQHLGSGDPGQPGNMVFSGHNDIYGEVFRRLDELQPGDEIQIHSTTEIFTYVVTGWKIVAPTEVSVLAASAYPSLTLISCYPYLVDTERIVVSADIKTK